MEACLGAGRAESSAGAKADAMLSLRKWVHDGPEQAASGRLRQGPRPTV